VDAERATTATASRKLELAVLARRGHGLSARLAGVRVVEAAPGQEAAAFHELVREERLGVLAVDQELLDLVPPEDRLRRDRPLPVVIPFAVPRRWSEAGRGRDYVAALIRRAVGYHVKLGEGGPSR
jgi:V/A-type H+-transporting ATPase subunit F